MNKLYISTTTFGVGSTSLGDVLGELSQLASSELIDGVEIGSTHKAGEADLENTIKKYLEGLEIFTHNYFPPAEPDFVMNISSTDENIRLKSVNHAKKCIDFSQKINSKLYTIHPGFMSDSVNPSTMHKGSTDFDFRFNDSRYSYNDCFKNLIESLAELTEYSKSCNINIAIETEGSLTKQNILMMERPEEYAALFQYFKENLYINFNLAHSRFSSIANNFLLDDFIIKYSEKILAIELSDNDGFHDNHWPIQKNSYIFEWIDKLPKVPLILEFRHSNIVEVKKSLNLVRKFLQE